MNGTSALRGSSWINDFSSAAVMFVGLTEIAGGLAMFPPVLKISSPLTVTVGTAGLIVVMLGAAVVHARRRESEMIILNVPQRQWPGPDKLGIEPCL
jgi:DoxX-like family